MILKFNGVGPKKAALLNEKKKTGLLEKCQKSTVTSNQKSTINFLLSLKLSL